MLRVRNLSNQFQKRLIRPLYAQTQATPYAGELDPTLRNADGSVHVPLTADSGAAQVLDYAGGNTYSLQGGLVPGTCLVKTQGNHFVPHNGASGPLTWGLLANFVGGTLDDLQDNNEIGVWRGPDSVFELLYPAFDDTNLATLETAANASGVNVPLYANVDGRLSGNYTTSAQVVARLVERVSPAVIHISLEV